MTSDGEPEGSRAPRRARAFRCARREAGARAWLFTDENQPGKTNVAVITMGCGRAGSTAIVRSLADRSCSSRAVHDHWRNAEGFSYPSRRDV